MMPEIFILPDDTLGDKTIVLHFFLSVFMHLIYKNLILTWLLQTEPFLTDTTI